MEAEIERVPNADKAGTVLARSWQEFTDKAMDLLVENPTTAKFVLKYLPKTHKFVLRVTDGRSIVIRKCSAEELGEVEKFTLLAGRAFTNEGNKKAVKEIEVEDKKKPNKKKKR